MPQANWVTTFGVRLRNASTVAQLEIDQEIGVVISRIIQNRSEYNMK
jgi:hypothetical protein